MQVKRGGRTRAKCAAMMTMFHRRRITRTVFQEEVIREKCPTPNSAKMSLTVGRLATKIGLNQSINQSINQSNHTSLNQPINHSVNQPNHTSLNQSIIRCMDLQIIPFFRVAIFICKKKFHIEFFSILKPFLCRRAFI